MTNVLSAGPFGVVKSHYNLNIFDHFRDVIGSIFVVTIQRIIGEVVFISANFDGGISWNSIFYVVV